MKGNCMGHDCKMGNLHAFEDEKDGLFVKYEKSTQKHFFKVRYCPVCGERDKKCFTFAAVKCDIDSHSLIENFLKKQLELEKKVENLTRAVKLLLGLDENHNRDIPDDEEGEDHLNQDFVGKHVEELSQKLHQHFLSNFTNSFEKLVKSIYRKE